MVYELTNKSCDHAMLVWIPRKHMQRINEVAVFFLEDCHYAQKLVNVPRWKVQEAKENTLEVIPSWLKE